MDRVTIYKKERWLILAGILSLFALRVYYTKGKHDQCEMNDCIGYAVVTYLLGLFYLNQVFLFLTPLEDPDELPYNTDSESILPTRYITYRFIIIANRESDEFKPFQRKI